jgi:hypothetical protein
MFISANNENNNLLIKYYSVIMFNKAIRLFSESRMRYLALSEISLPYKQTKWLED